VAYTDAAKIQQLGVPPELLRFQGAVSAPVAEAMAWGALARSEADIALAVTGFAGRGAAHEEPGLVFFGAVRSGWPIQTKEAHFGDIGRGAVRVACLRQALEMLEKVVG
jgi:nicotinamide-nucleotide amidase